MPTGENLVQRTLSEVQFENRKLLSTPSKTKGEQMNLAFRYTTHPAVPNLNQILMKAWHLIEQQPLFKEVYKDLPLIFYTERAVSQSYTRNSQIIRKA